MADTIVDESCIEPERGLSGRITIDPFSITLALYDYDRRSGLHEQDSFINIKTCTAHFCTLVGCTRTLLRSFSRTESVVKHQIEANYALIGSRNFRPEEAISIVEFCLPEAPQSLFYNEHQEIDSEEYGSDFVHIDRTYESRLEISKFGCEDITITISKKRCLGIVTKDNIGSDPTWISIEYSNPVPWQEFMRIPFHTEVFFALSEGRPLRMKGIGLRMHREHCTLQDKDHQDEFELYQASDQSLRLPRETFGSEPLFRISDNAERSITVAALRAWIDRRSDWDVVYWCASQFIDDSHLTTRGGLLRAMAWFEAIPTYKMDDLVSRRGIEKLYEQVRAMSEFETLSIPNDRLKQVLGEMRRLPLNERIEKAYQDISRALGDRYFLSSFIDDCKLAKKIRDNAAHGNPPDLENDFGTLLRASSAIETLALFATIISLGVVPTRIGRIMSQNTPHPYASYASWVPPPEEG